MLTKIDNQHLFKTRVNNIHKFSTTLFGATIIYFLQIFNRSSFNSTGRISIESKVVIRDRNKLNDVVSMKVYAKTKIKEMYRLNGTASLSLEYTTPLTWNNLIIRYSTWEDVMQRFNTWDDVKTYR